MSVSPYTLESLYNKGVLDYVPYELSNDNTNVSSLNGNNPYLDMAKQGGLYQDYNTDNFQYQNTSNNQLIGENNNMYSSQYQANTNIQTGINPTSMNSSDANSLHGTLNSQNDSNTLNSDSREAFMNTMQEGILEPKVGKKEKSYNLIKGLITGGIIIGTVCLCLKKGKQQATSKNFLSKLKFWKK